MMRRVARRLRSDLEAVLSAFRGVAQHTFAGRGSGTKSTRSAYA
jgi:hypothetical protein